MADWATVRHDPAWDEPIDAEIVPLLDVLNDNRFVTTSSCCGHGHWAYVHLVSDGGVGDERFERLARFLDHRLDIDYHPHAAWASKHIADKRHWPSGWYWLLEIRAHAIYANTPASEGLAATVVALAEVTGLVAEFCAAEAQ